MFEELLKYQETDAKLHKIETELAESEARKKAVSAKKYLAGVEENVTKLDLKAAELSAAYENTVKTLTELKEQEVEFEKAIGDAEDENAINFLLKKTDELLARIKSVAAESARIQTDIQSVLKDYAAIAMNTRAATTQYNENGKIFNELKASRQPEMDEIKKELAELEKKVDPALMEKYRAKREKKIFPIIYPANGEFCGYCNMQLNMADLSKLKNGEIIECDQCGRLIYKG